MDDPLTGAEKDKATNEALHDGRMDMLWLLNRIRLLITTNDGQPLKNFYPIILVIFLIQHQGLLEENNSSFWIHVKVFFNLIVHIRGQGIPDHIVRSLK